MIELGTLVKFALAALLVLLLLQALAGRTTEGGEELGDLLKDMLSGGKACTKGEYAGKTEDFFVKEFAKHTNGKDWEEILRLYRGLNTCFGVGATYSWLEGGSPQTVVEKSATVNLGSPLSGTADLTEAMKYVDMAEQFEAAMSTQAFSNYKQNLDNARKYVECRKEVEAIDRSTEIGTEDSLALAYVKYKKAEAIGCGGVINGFESRLDNIHRMVDRLSDRAGYDDAVGSYLCQIRRTALTMEDREMANRLVNEDPRTIECR